VRTLAASSDAAAADSRGGSPEGGQPKTIRVEPQPPVVESLYSHTSQFTYPSAQAAAITNIVEVSISHWPLSEKENSRSAMLKAGNAPHINARTVSLLSVAHLMT